MDRYRWNVLVLFGMRWKNFGETKTEERNKVVVFFVVVFSVEKRINTSTALDFLFTRTS